MLRRHPGLLWQQLHNRLQWEDEPVRAVLEPEFERRSVPGASPWLRTRTRSRESEALLRTLEGHAEERRRLRLQPRRRPGWSRQARMRRSDLGRRDGPGDSHLRGPHRRRLGLCLQSRRRPGGLGKHDHDAQALGRRDGPRASHPQGHTDGVSACAFSPDGARVISASSDMTLKLWDAETGRELRTLEGHTDGSAPVPSAPTVPGWSRRAGTRPSSSGTPRRAGSFAPSRATPTASGPVPSAPTAPGWSWQATDRTLKLWDAETGQELRTLAGHTDRPSMPVPSAPTAPGWSRRATTRRSSSGTQRRAGRSAPSRATPEGSRRVPSAPTAPGWSRQATTRR